MAEDTTTRKPTSKSAAVVFQGASKLVGLVIQFFFYRYCVLWLGETGFGTFQFAVSCAAFLGLADLGIPAATQRFLGEAMAKGDLERVATIFRYVRVLHASLAGLAILLFGAFALMYDSSMRTHASDPHALILFLCGLQTASVIVMSPALTIAYALGRFKEVAWINFVQVTLTPLLGIVMLYNYRTPEMLATTTLVGGVVSVFLAYRLCGARVLPKGGRLEPEERRQLFGLSARGYPTSIATVVGGNADKLLVQRAGVAGSLGSYYIAGRLPETIFQVVFPLAATVYPELTRLSSTDPDGFDRAVERNTRFALALAGSLIIVPSALSECILRFWMHDGFVNGNPGVLLVLPFMAVYRALEIVYGVLGMVLFAKGVPQFGLPFAVFNALVTVFATVPMYRWQGIAGVGLMNALIDLAQIVPIIFVLKRFVAPGVRLRHLAGGFASVLTLSAAFFALLRLGVDQPLAKTMPVVGFCLAPVAALLALAVMVRLRLCEVPDGVAARLKRVPFGKLVLGPGA